MASRRPSLRPSVANGAQLRMSLRRSGLSDLGIQQALQGNVVSAPADRAAIARILAAFAALPAHTEGEIFDYPGDYPLKHGGDADVH